MAKYIFKRIVISIITLYILATIVFFLMKIMPGGPFDTDLITDPRVLAQIYAQFNLDQPLNVQYFLYMRNLARGNLGESFRRPATVNNSIAILFPVTLRLGSVAFIYAVTAGIGMGTLAALTKVRAIRNVVLAIVTAGVSIPGFLLGLFLLYIFAIHFQILPAIGLRTWRHFIMPAMALSFFPIAFISRMTRSVLTEVMRQDYIVMARAKGLSRRVVIFKHALKNALLPIITYMGPMMAYMMVGSFVVETLFAIPGIGREFVSSVQARDYPMIMGMAIFLGAFIILMNLIVDILYGFIDPRIKIQK